MSEVIDLSRLPPLDIVKPVDHAELLADTVKKAGLTNPSPSDPGYRVTAENTYREVLVRKDANEQAKGLTLAYARKAELDHIGVTYYRTPDGKPVTRLKKTITETSDIKTYPLTINGAIETVNGRYQCRIVGNPTADLEVLDTERKDWIVASSEGDRANLYSYTLQGSDYILRFEQLGFPDDLTGINTVNLIQTKTEILGDEFEGDEDYRQRLHHAPAGYSVAGPESAYQFHAKSAHPDIKSVKVTSPAPVEVILFLQTYSGNGLASRALCDLVRAYVEPFRPLTDLLKVEAGEILEYSLNARITIKAGPSPSEVLKAARANLKTYLDEQNIFGGEIAQDGLYWALRVEGVTKVELLNWTDIVAANHQAPFCVSMVVTDA